MNKNADELLDRAIAFVSELPNMSTGLASEHPVSYVLTMSDLSSRMRSLKNQRRKNELESVQKSP